MYNGTAINVKKTSDGGFTWEEQFTGHTSTNFKRIATPNKGIDVFVAGGAGILIHTNDGGVNWNTVAIGIGSTQVRDIQFLSNTIGYIAADNATILKTTDSGASWFNLNANISGVNTIGKIFFLTENRGFIGGFNFFKETFDGGLNWTDVPGHEPGGSGSLFQIQEIQFIDANIGYISGDIGLLYKTTDAGETWVDKQVVISGFDVESLFDFKFLNSNPNYGFACGYHGLLIRTYDGGDSWELMTSDIAGTNTSSGSPFNALDFYGNKGLMIGQHGEVLAYEFSSASVAETKMNQSLNIYPNPVLDILQLHIEFSETPIEEISIFSLNGELVMKINKPVDNQISCHSLEPGTYFIKAILKNKIATKLFIKE